MIEQQAGTVGGEWRDGFHRDLEEYEVEQLRARFAEQGAGGPVMVLPVSEPVWLLRVPAEGVCAAEPTLEWRSGPLRQTWPTAVGVSQCALTPGHESPLHVAVLFVPTGGEQPAVCYASQVGFFA